MSDIWDRGPLCQILNLFSSLFVTYLQLQKERKKGNRVGFFLLFYINEANSPCAFAISQLK